MLYDALARHDPLPRRPAQPGGRPCPVTAIPPTRWPSSTGLSGALAVYHLFHAVRAELLTALGRHDEAREANRTALGLTANDAERRLLTTRLHRHPLEDGS